jgi:hypothetical protein
VCFLGLLAFDGLWIAALLVVQVRGISTGTVIAERVAARSTGNWHSLYQYDVGLVNNWRIFLSMSPSRVDWYKVFRLNDVYNV